MSGKITDLCSFFPKPRPKLSLKRGASLLLFLLLGLSVCGCSTLKMKKKQQCKNMDMYKKGYRDAKAGASSHFDSYQAKCSEYNIPLNRQKYMEGRAAGLKDFCVREEGYEFGLQGKKYRNTCPKGKEGSFLAGYKKGAQKCLYEEGQKDALGGKTSSFAKSRCPKLKENPNEKEYGKGYQTGLRAFCVYKNGYSMGIKSAPYKNICSGKLKAKFMAGYKKGAQKCLYGQGRSDALYGRANLFPKTACLQLKGNFSEKEYGKGYQTGLRAFCVYKNGYHFGLQGRRYQNTCPQKLEDDFFKGYSLGLKEYKEERRQEELLALERERIRAEDRARSAALQLERERVETEKEYLMLQKIKSYGYQLCDYDSDCGEESYCLYNYEFSQNICTR